MSSPVIGSPIRRYTILKKLGEGGMGIVYKAHDTRLDRVVALKTLRPQAVLNQALSSRFMQEARTASALNHPNIITVHDIDATAEPAFITMEYVDGRTIAKVIGHRGLAVPEALRYAVQIADALAAAHSVGIIHRDIKPANIMVTRAGLVKVLDFGLAKLSQSINADNETTQTYRPDTQAGTIVGTVSYMSPEQAEGKELDARSDIFSFGSVFYELITGHRAFTGGSTVATLSAILHSEPTPVSEITRGVPAEIERIVNRCLRKDPGRRFQHAADLKVALEELKQESGSARPADKELVAQSGHGKHRYAWLAAAAVLSLIVAGVWQRFRPAAIPPELIRIPLTSYPGSEQVPTFSPDGSQVAFSWNGEKKGNYNIYVKVVDGGAPVRVTTSSSDDRSPAWSPDGRFIAFVRDGAVYVISPLGGPERHVTGDATLPVAGNVAWFPESDSLVVSALEGGRRPASLFRVRLDTEERRKLTSPPEGLTGDVYPAVAPDGQWIAFARYSDSPFSTLQIVPAAGGQARALAKTGVIIGLAWMPGGKELIFSSNMGGAQALWRIPASYGPSKAPVLIPAAGDNIWFPVVALLRSGSLRLAYEQRIADANIWTMEAPEAGAKAVSPRSLIASTRMDYSPQFSPDGRRIVFESDRSGYREIWLCDRDGSNPMQVTSLKSLRSGTPRWSPDGSRIAFDSLAAGNNDIWIVGADGGAPRRLTTESSNDARPSWSHDGRWIYFRSDRSGAQQIWKMPADGGAAVQLTREGGFEAFESPDSSLVYYVKSPNHPGLWSIPPSGGPETTVVTDGRAGYWALCDPGVYYVVPGVSSSAPSQIYFFAFATRQSRPVGAIEKLIQWSTPGLTVSRDGRRIAWSQVDNVESDLMLVENFR